MIFEAVRLSVMHLPVISDKRRENPKHKRARTIYVKDANSQLMFRTASCAAGWPCERIFNYSFGYTRQRRSFAVLVFWIFFAVHTLTMSRIYRSTLLICLSRISSSLMWIFIAEPSTHFPSSSSKISGQPFTTYDLLTIVSLSLG